MAQEIELYFGEDMVLKTGFSASALDGKKVIWA